MKTGKKALLIVDLQRDFCPGGRLSTPFGNKIVPEVNSVMEKFDIVLASKDWHPKESVHFDKWPKHCIQDEPGAEFHRELNVDSITKVFLKGTEDSDEGYSAFEATNADLKQYLLEMDVSKLYICGLTAEYCVKQTVLDSLKAGFNTYVVVDAIEGVRAQDIDMDKAFQEMGDAGANLIYSSEIV